MRNSIIIPVFKNEETIPDLVKELQGIASAIEGDLEVVFVDDGSPDNSYAEIIKNVYGQQFSTKIIRLSRNYGSFNAIRAGFAEAQGEFCACMAADLQDPPATIVQFFEQLKTKNIDIIVGTRETREDPLTSRIFSRFYWNLYRRFIQKEMPKGGMDIFGCSEIVKLSLNSFSESRTSLVGLLLWVGFRRSSIPYKRRKRPSGRSAWSLKKKVDYLKDSCFAFTDLPIRLLQFLGAFGSLLSLSYLVVVVIGYFFGAIAQPGFPTLVGLITLFGAASLFAQGVLAEYAWRAYENTKNRPNFIVSTCVHIKN